MAGLEAAAKDLTENTSSSDIRSRKIKNELIEQIKLLQKQQEQYEKEIAEIKEAKDQLQTTVESLREQLLEAESAMPVALRSAQQPDFDDSEED